MKAIVALLLSTIGSLTVCRAQTGAEVLQKYQAAILKTHTVGYDVQRIDTFPSGTVWNHQGHGILARNADSKILKAHFLVSRPDRATAYLYDGTKGYELDTKAKTYLLQPNPYGPGVMGDPNGQMVVEELLAVEPLYQRLTYQESRQGPTLTLHYPDEPKVDILNRSTTLVLDRSTGLATSIRTVMLRGGSKWSTTKTLSNLRVNEAADAEAVTGRVLLAAYTPATAVAPEVKPTLEGKAAPDFELLSFNQKPVQLSRYRGQVVLLDFWTTSCSPCISSLPRVQHLGDLHKEKGLAVLGVLMDPKNLDRARGILLRQKASYLNALGTDKLEAAYQVHTYPRYVLVGKSGQVLFDAAGYSAELEAAVKAAVGSSK